MASEASGKGAEESPGLLSGHQGRVGNHQDTEGGPHTEQTTKSALSSGYPPLHPLPLAAGVRKKCMLGNSKECKKFPNTNLLPQPTISTIRVDAGGGHCSQLGTHVGITRRICRNKRPHP